MSVSPAFAGATQAGTSDPLEVGGVELDRRSIDPDDFTGGFAVWSGTSFAAPYVAGDLVDGIAAAIQKGALDDPAERARILAGEAGLAHVEVTVTNDKR